MLKRVNIRGLEINYNKTKILKIHFSNRFNRDKDFSYKVGNEFNYLGVPFTSNLKWDLAIHTAINRGNTTVNAKKL